jgi:hypothetical protein
MFKVEINWQTLAKCFYIMIIILSIEFMIIQQRLIIRYEQMFNFSADAMETMVAHYRIIESGRKTILIYDPNQSDIMETNAEDVNLKIKKKK